MTVGVCVCVHVCMLYVWMHQVNICRNYNLRTAEATREHIHNHRILNHLHTPMKFRMRIRNLILQVIQRIISLNAHRHHASIDRAFSAQIASFILDYMAKQSKLSKLVKLHT